jgi:hypothetical protein
MSTSCSVESSGGRLVSALEAGLGSGVGVGEVCLAENTDVYDIEPFGPGSS